MSDDDRILLLGEPSAVLGDLVGRGVGFETVSDLDVCLSRLEDAGPAISLVLVDGAWPQPLAAVREVRRADATIGLAVATQGAQAEALRTKLSFLPDADNVAVLVVDATAQELRRRLEELATTSRQRQRVRGALDAINRNLAGSPPGGGRRARSTGVSEQYLAALVRHAADTIVSIDPQGRVVTVNEAARRTLGLDPREAEGRLLAAYLADDDPGRLTAMLAAAAAGEAQVEDELGVHLADGPRLVLSATAAPIRDDTGSLAGLALIARDVTLEREAEQRLRALQKAESLATLASGVAHDFNNLLVQAQGWADLARGDPEDTDLVTTALDNIVTATRGAAELARAMLAYGGRGRFETEMVQVARLVEDLRPLMTASVRSGLAVEVELSETPEVRVDPTQLRQIILNLVTNAAEAIGEDPGAIRVRTGSQVVERDDARTKPEGELPSGRYVVVEVSDDGPGVESGLHERLFDPFFTTKFTGRGLGLAASQGIARAHGGVITVDSRPGEGACFTVHLPIPT